MGRHRDRQRQGTLGTGLFHQHVGALDRFLVTGDDHLARGVEVDRRDHLPLRRFLAVGGDGVVVQTYDGGHGAGAFRHGFLHGEATQFNQLDRIGKRQGAAAHQGGILAQAVTSHDGGGCPALLLPQAPQGDGCCQQCWLGAPGLVQILGGTIQHQGQQVIAQHLARLGEGLFNHGVLLGEFRQHADALGALSREGNGKSGHH